MTFKEALVYDYCNPWGAVTAATVATVSTVLVTLATGWWEETQPKVFMTCGK